MKTAVLSTVASLAVFFFLATAIGPVAAQPVDATLQSEFRRIIRTQIEAFRRDDGETAFAQASPAIRARFGSAERFMAMVRSTYEPVYRPRDYRFEPALAFPDRTAQPVHVTAADGRSVLAVYYMERQQDDSWRISGVYLLPMPEREI